MRETLQAAYDRVSFRLVELSRERDAARAEMVKVADWCHAVLAVIDKRRNQWERRDPTVATALEDLRHEIHGLPGWTGEEEAMSPAEYRRALALAAYEAFWAQVTIAFALHAWRFNAVARLDKGIVWLAEPSWDIASLSPIEEQVRRARGGEAPVRRRGYA